MKVLVEDVDTMMHDHLNECLRKLQIYEKN